MSGAPTPQINVSKIPGGPGIAGALFALSTMFIFLVGVPRIRYFFVGAIILGCVIALILRFVRHETPGKPWILPASQDPHRTALPLQRAKSNERAQDLRRDLLALTSRFTKTAIAR